MGKKKPIKDFRELSKLLPEPSKEDLNVGVPDIHPPSGSPTILSIITAIHDSPTTPAGVGVEKPENVAVTQEARKQPQRSEKIRNFLGGTPDWSKRSTIRVYLNILGCDWFMYDDMSVDIHSNIRIQGIVKELPFKIRTVCGDFVWIRSMLGDWENMPNEVNGDFTCTHMNVHTLTSCFPKMFGGDIDISFSKRLLDVHNLPKIIDRLDMSHCAVTALNWDEERHIRMVLASNCSIKSLNLDNIKGLQYVDASNNYITSKIDSDVEIDYSSNPCDPNDEYDTARW